jgi:2-iminoacetate synthase
MDLAKPGDIKAHCDPNALATFAEYLQDYASEETRHIGDSCVATILAAMDPDTRQRSAKMVEQVRAGDRDVYC